MGILENIAAFVDPKGPAGQGRTRALYGLLDTIGQSVSQFVPPNLRPQVMSGANVLDMVNPVANMRRAGTDLSQGNFGSAFIEVAGVAIPAGIVAKYGAKTALDAAKYLSETLALTSGGMRELGESAYEEVITRLNQPGEVPDMGSNLGNVLFRGQEPLPGTSDQISQAVDKVPEMENILQYLSPEEAATVTTRTAPTLEAAFRATNPNELISAAVEGAPKLGWYKESGKALNTIFEDDTRRFASLLAALSPQTSVEMNLENAVNVWSNWTKAGRPKDPNEILEIMGRSVLGDKGTDSVLDAWKNNAIRTLSKPEGTPGDDFRLSGPKVDSFGYASSGDLDRYVNDAWMANLTGVPQDLFSRGSGKNNPGYSPGYLGSSAAGRQAAQKMSNILGEEIMPSEVQETAWSFGKALYEQMAEGMPTGGPSATQIIQQGLLSPQRVTDVPDFATLLQQEKYGNPLREVGYGSVIDEAARLADPIGTRDISGAAISGGAENVARRLDSLYQHRQFVSAATPFRFGFGNNPAARGSGNLVLPSYGKPSGRSVPLSFGGSGRVIEPTQEFVSLVEKTRVQPQNFVRLSADSPSRKAFVEKMTEAQNSRGILGKSVDVYKPTDYKGYQLYTTPDGSGGFAISKSGELSSVVSKKGATGIGFSDNVLAAGLQNGAKWLNAFDTVLPQKYARFGFKPVARIKFDEDFVREEWGDQAVDEFMQVNQHFNSGKPDLVFMVFDPNFTNTVANNVGGKIVDNYDKGLKAVDQAIARMEKN